MILCEAAAATNPIFFGFYRLLCAYLTRMTTLGKIRRTVAEHELFESANKTNAVLVALSGGPDSVALLHLLSRLKRSLKLRLGAVYVNHQIRKRASKKEERFCQFLCDSLKVPLTIVRGDVPAAAKRDKLGLEEAAREFRYATFEHLADEDGFDRIAVGHHADDQVETILFRLFRGTGPTGLIGMPYRRGKIIRPMLDLTREEILLYLKENQLDWCEDKSNQSLKFKRNYIRHRLLPAVRKNLNPRVENAVLALADTVAVDEQFLLGVVEQASRKCLSTTPGGKFELALDLYRGYGAGLRRRLLRRCLKATWQSGQTPTKEVVERLDRLALSESGSVSLPGQVQATVADDLLIVFVRQKRILGVTFEPGVRLELDWPAVDLTGRVTKSGKPSRLSALTKRRSSRVRLDWDRLTPPLQVRTIKPGDRFRPLGMRGSKKVGDYLTDRRVNRVLRDEILLLCDQQGPVWLIGYEIADRVKIDDQTRKVLSVGYHIRKGIGRSPV
jgi:tRNA(Ile)-lysidine synthase